MATKKIGVLALQGNFAMHAQAVWQAGATVELIRKPEELSALSGLIIPGGESTTMLKHFEVQPAWWDALHTFHAQNKAFFGTCAGLILLARDVVPEQRSLGLLDVEVTRNAYGRQLESHNIIVKFQIEAETKMVEQPFIRAPKIIAVGSRAKEIGWVENEVVMVEQDKILGAACHPEAVTTLVHRYFIEKIVTR